MQDRLSEIRSNIAPVDYNAQQFSEHSDILSLLEITSKKWQSIHDRLSELEQEANSFITEWETEKNTTAWIQAFKTDMSKYKQLHSELEQQGINPDKYPLLLTQQKNVQRELDLINDHKSRLHKLEV